MSDFSRMLRHCRAVDVFVAIRSAVMEPQQYRAPSRLQYDPWFGADPDYTSAWAGAPVEVAR